MCHEFTAEEFFDALHSEQGVVTKPTVTGYVRKTADQAFIDFSPALALCAIWIRIPLSMIAKVTVLGKRPCFDHVHDYVRLTFKSPASPEAAVFAQLLQHTATSTQMS